VTRLTGFGRKSRTKCHRNTKIDRKVVHPTGNNAHQFQGQRSRSPDREVEDQYQHQALLSLRSKVKAERSRDASNSCFPISRERNDPEISKGRKVVHPTGNNAHQFQGQRQRSRSPGRHNAETGSASYLTNGKAYEFQTLCTDYRWRTKTRIAVMDHHQEVKG